MHKLLVPSLAVAASLTLAGCTFGPAPAPAPAPSQTSQVTTDDGTVNITSSGNSVTFTGNNDNSAFSIGAGLPSNWPGDLPTPDGTTVAFAGTEQNDDGTTTYSATFGLPAGADVSAALNSLKSAFQRAGWTVGDESFGTFGITAGGFEAEKGLQTASVAYIGINTTSTNADEASSTITISAEYPR